MPVNTDNFLKVKKNQNYGRFGDEEVGQPNASDVVGVYLDAMEIFVYR